MNNVSVLILGSLVLVASCATRPGAPMAGPDQTGAAMARDGLPATDMGTTNNPWPMTFNDGATRYAVFEPQCDSWDGHQLLGRSVVAVQPAGQMEPTYGVVAFSALTLVDKAARCASLVDFRLSSADFASAGEPGRHYPVPVLIHLSKHAPPVPLDRLEQSFASATFPGVERLNNAPPKIIVANRPSVLVYIDGPPAWRPAPGTDLQRVINTGVFLLRDKSGQCYLRLFDGYLQASSLAGPWTPAGQPPAGAELALKQATDSGPVDLLPGTPDPVTHREPSLRLGAPPEVYVATTPSELITFDGPPAYAAIPGTELLYAANTSGNVFKLLTDQSNYILISGRWFRAPSLHGPWTFVPGNQLPGDFANIPDQSPKENVKASVPGTPQAEEALLANSIPQSTAVARSTPMPAPRIDGPLRLAPIAGTPLRYVLNSATPIIEVDSQSWYACQNGVWFAATSAQGPWVVAAAVPAVIYTIPTDSPLHYLTYVAVYGSTPDTVYEGYTPGYLGTEVGADGTVVYGTGYAYNPWIDSEWYGPPLTYGCGFDACWTPWWGWGFDCGFGWGCGWGFGGFGCFPPFPWWGGYWGDHHRGFGRGFDRWGHRGGWANTGADVYHSNRPIAGSRFNAAGVNAPAAPSASSGFGRAYNSRTGQLAGGQRSQVPRVTGNAWNSSRAGALVRSSADNRNFGGGAANAANRPWYDGASRQQARFASPYGVLNRGFSAYPHGGGHDGGRFNAAPRGGGWFGGRGGGGGGGGHGGGGGGGHGGGGGGGHGGR